MGGRVLRPDGTLWLNLGDSYARAHGPGVRQAKGGTPAYPDHVKRGSSDDHVGRGDRPGTRAAAADLKEKDLVGIPWRVALALQADGWYLRTDIIWNKPNAMPESVRDRPTRSHEYLFLLTQSPSYHYDADAIAEEGAEPDRQRSDRIGGANGHTVRHSLGGIMGATAMRNARTVWTLPSQPYAGAHFAVFPQALPERCIKAGCPPGGVVLDPFAGSGTTGLVAQRLGRQAVLIDVSMEYLGQVMVRNAQKPLGLL